MAKNHIIELLSGYIDDAVTESERRQVDAHLTKCASCQKELDALKKVSKLVASLPQHDLPAGFHERLRARRRREDEPDPAIPALWLPLPSRSFAVALSSVVLCLFIFRDVADRLSNGFGPPIELSPSALMDAKVARHMPAEAVRDLAQSDADSVGLSASESKKEDAFTDRAKSGKKAAGTRGKVAGAAGQPLVGEEEPAPQGSMTNMEIRKFLDDEGRKMGIRRIVPPGRAPAVQTPQSQAEPEGAQLPPAAWEGIPAGPLDKDQQRSAMRRMTQNLYQINQQSQWKRAPTVPLSGSTPRVLGSEGATVARGDLVAKDRPAVKTSFDSGSIGYTGRNAEERLRKGENTLKERSPKPFAGTGTMTMASTSGVKQKAWGPPSRSTLPIAAPPAPTRSTIKTEADDESRPENAPVSTRTLVWTRSWAEVTGGMGVAGGAVIINQLDWTDMHRRIGFAKELPEVDFTREMVVGIFADASPSKKRRAEIVSVMEDGSRLLIRYRVIDEVETGPPGPSSPYHIVIVPKSDLQFTFIQVP